MRSQAPPHEYQPLAVIGAACRFPGGDRDITGYDDLIGFIRARGDAVREVPAERWNLATWYSDDESQPGRMYVRRGAFLNWDFRLFDAALYGISPREAGIMDPQQRLVMDTALDCLHHAGADFDELVGSLTGVFIGGFMLDHLGNTLHPANRDLIGSHSATSATMTMLSNRLSYALGLRGPSLTVDTACSSSMVALHLACRALQNRDADLCLAGGVNFMTRPETTIMLCKGQFLARDGRSKSFDAKADGYGRGEGCGVVALKRLADAEADGDRILAVIAGSGINQDGTTPGISVPNGEAQAALIEKVYAEAGISAADVNYFEAHGTGTPVGDPIEVGAISRVLDRAGATGDVKLGSIKSGLGHQEAAAGVAGLIKAVATVHQRQVFPQAWLEEQNPELHLERTPLSLVVGEPHPLPAEGRLFASVNSFGYGGTNAHAVVASYA